MPDEQKIRDQVINRKEQKQAKAQKIKARAIEQAKLEQMTDDQRNIIASKDDASANVDKTKLAEAEALAAQIESGSFSKFDIDFERRVSRR